ncbi:MAG: hypothetical protein A2X01_14905 [Bacteroidetes bacterium GWF2_35_48]|nr:MAG: hypothetical protein A2X01_14905 [Bacteroidetes bacterium GWF2_35_48]
MPVFPVWLSTYLYPVIIVLSVFTSLYVSLAFSSKFKSKDDKSDLSPERNKNENKYSFNLEAEGGWINITNPFRGNLIIGGAGSGKSKSFAEPIIEQLIQKDYSGILYDFKFPELTNVVYSSIINNNKKVSFYIVNFTDLSRSQRTNPLNPRYLSNLSYADEYTEAIFNNLMPELLTKGPDFWSRSSKSLFQAVMWFIKKHHPEYCTLPHVIAICLNPNIALTLQMLATDIETRGLVASIITAHTNKSTDQLSGIIATVQSTLARLNTQEIFWVLSGDDFDLNINDPEDPKFLCLGSFPTLVDSLAPVISLIITVGLKLMNQQGKHHSAFLDDEAPTLYIPKLEQIPATARSNKVAVIYMAQDFSQMEDKFGKTKRDTIIANLNNQFYGRIGHKDTVNYVTTIYGKEDRTVINQSTSSSKGQSDSSSLSSSESTQERHVLKTQDVFNLKPGEFCCVVVETGKSYMKAQLKQPKKNTKHPIPEFSTGIDTAGNFTKIYEECESILIQYDANYQKKENHIDRLFE